MRTDIDNRELILILFVRVRRTTSLELLDLGGNIGLALGMGELLSLVFEGLGFPVF